MRRDTRDVLIQSLVLLVLVAGGIMAPVWVRSEAQRDQEELTCELYVLNQKQLLAVRQVGRELGLPSNFEIPEVPETCEP